MGSERESCLHRVNDCHQHGLGASASHAPEIDAEHLSMDDLLRLYWQPLVSYASSLLNSADAAEDVVQEAFIRVWERRADWSPNDSMRSLLYRISRNLAFNEQRSRRVRARWRGNDHADGKSNPTPLQMVQAGELSAAVEQAIARLPERRREVFLLVRFHGLSYRQIADVMEISPQTVANHMSAALADLREYLAAHVDQPASRPCEPVAREAWPPSEKQPSVVAGSAGPK